MRFVCQSDHRCYLGCIAVSQDSTHKAQHGPKTAHQLRGELGYLTVSVEMNLFLASYRFNKAVSEVTRAVVTMILVLLFGILLITYFPYVTTALPHWSR